MFRRVFAFAVWVPAVTHGTRNSYRSRLSSCSLHILRKRVSRQFFIGRPVRSIFGEGCQGALRLFQTRVILSQDINVANELKVSSTNGVSKKDFVVLGIETSCDDTGAAVVTNDRRILGEAVSSQMELHEPYGGIVPRIARDAHSQNIDKVVSKALSMSGLRPHELSAVAVTTGPGLSICLKVGVTAAKQLAAEHNLPFISINHMEGHALVARLTDPSLTFPFLALLISGGHNLLLVVHDVGSYTQLGATVDDALGEAYDKTARIIGLPVGGGGGPALEKLALDGDPYAFEFSLPMSRVKNCDFSYAGLKTAVRLAAEKAGDLSRPSETGRSTVGADLAASFQRVAVAHLEDRTRRAVEWCKDIAPLAKHLVVSGGVASNQYIRSRLDAIATEAEMTLVCPPPRLCTDNGVMIAWVGVERFGRGITDNPEEIDIRPRWPLGPQLTGDKYVVSRQKVTGAGLKIKYMKGDLTSEELLRKEEESGSTDEG